MQNIDPHKLLETIQHVHSSTMQALNLLAKIAEATAPVAGTIGTAIGHPEVAAAAAIANEAANAIDSLIPDQPGQMEND